MNKKKIDTKKDKLDRIFSEYIRLRDADINGNIRCYCCGRVYYWRQCDNMHYIGRSKMSLRYSETNCHAGCTRCNRDMCGNLEAYEKHLIKDYGNNIIDDLIRQGNEFKKWSESDFDAEIIRYKEAIKVLRKEKNIND